jgi:hypothetical protein
VWRGQALRLATLELTELNPIRARILGMFLLEVVQKRTFFWLHTFSSFSTIYIFAWRGLPFYETFGPEIQKKKKLFSSYNLLHVTASFWASKFEKFKKSNN